MALQPTGTDPASKATIECILMWKAALMDAWCPRPWMLRVMSEAISNTQAAAQPWDHIFGPASAVVASMVRL
eukprot:8517245-Karenia_brevis.AAC.1